jgi:signal transduction histidine kinase
VALGLAALAAAAVLATLGGILAVGLSFAAARDSFLISNAVIGLSCAGCGGLVAWHRPANPLGWQLLGAGIAQTTTPAVTPWLYRGLSDGWSDEAVHALATVYSGAWPWSVALFLPLAVLYFPDGQLPGRWWRAAVVAAAVNAPVQVLRFSADPDPLATVHELGPQAAGRGTSWLSLPALGGGPVGTASEVLLAATYLAGVVGLAVRYRGGDERTRRQLLWLLLAATVATVVILGERLVLPIGDGGFPIILTALIALVPIAMAVAVLRHQLLDIRVVWSRTLTYALLTAAVVVVYLGLVELGDRVLREAGLRVSVLATLVVAVGFDPVRVWLQGRVDRLLYGDRADPVHAASSVVDQLRDSAQRPVDVLPALCHALRLPHASLSDAAGHLGAHGVRPEHVERVPLPHGGVLEVGVRHGQRGLDPADRAVLRLLAVPLGVALRAAELSDTVQRSRREIVTAREEERRRLRRDLHDGLGPVLTGVAFRADAVASLANGDRVRALSEDIRSDVTGAIADVRRIIHRLRPAALDEIGLVEAVRHHAERLDRRPDGSPLLIDVQAVTALPPLSAAVEVAAYLIATEALTNLARHSRASKAVVELSVEPADDAGTLLLVVQDDGTGPATAWPPGVGLRSMAERAAELGGTLEAGPTPEGGRILTRLPLED